MKAVSLLDKPFGVGIKGMGYYLPEKIVTNKDLEKTLDTTDEWITTKIGVKQRHVCNSNQAASDLAIEAARMAIKNAGIRPLDIDLIIMTTLQPDNPDPMPCNIVQYKLGAVNAACFNLVVGGCPDSVFSLITGVNYILSGSYKNVLVVNAEVNSKMINWKDRGMCVFFGDGAGAWVLSPVKKGYGVLGFVLGNDGSNYDVIKSDAGGSRIPISHDAIDNNLIYPHMDGKKVYGFATNIIPESINKTLDIINLKPDDIDLYLFHQANINIIKKGLETLGMDMSKTYTNIDKYGNTASASLSIALAEAFEKKLVIPEKYIALSAFGAGLAWGSAVIKIPDPSCFI